MIKCSESLLTIPYFGNFEDDILTLLSSYVVIENDGVKVSAKHIAYQYEFLTRVVELSMRDWEYAKQNFLRTKYSSIFKNYKPGDFRRSTIPLLRLSGALVFKKSTQKDFVYFSLTKKLINQLESFDEIDS